MFFRLASARTCAVTESGFFVVSFGLDASSWRSLPTISADLSTNSSSGTPSAFSFSYCWISFLVGVSVWLNKLIAARPCPLEWNFLENKRKKKWSDKVGSSCHPLSAYDCYGLLLIPSNNKLVLCTAYKVKVSGTQTIILCRSVKLKKNVPWLLRLALDTTVGVMRYFRR